MNQKKDGAIFRGGGGMGQRGGGGRGRGLGGGTAPGSGPSGFCICPKCGLKIAHQVGQRCMDLSCPKCGIKMTRG